MSIGEGDSKNKGGRPPLKDEEKRTHNYKIRFNDFEHEKLISLLKSHDINPNNKRCVAPFIRNFILDISYNPSIEPNKTTDTFNKQSAKIAYEINKIGGNINQLMRLIHQKSKSKNTINISDDVDNIAIKMNDLILIAQQFLSDK